VAVVPEMKITMTTQKQQKSNAKKRERKNIIQLLIEGNLT